MTIKINLNADMAEGYGAYDIGDDSGILKIIGSANIACGFHAGDPLIMRRVVAEAKQNGVIPLQTGQQAQLRVRLLRRRGGGFEQEVFPHQFLLRQQFPNFKQDDVVNSRKRGGSGGGGCDFR
jgi:hypothetical protein